jgi:hypothetical protein
MSVHPSKRLAAVAAVLAVVALATYSACSLGEETTYLAAEGDSIGPVCVHLDMPYSGRICPDSAAAQTQFFLPSDIRSAALVVQTNDGRNIQVPIPPRTDAIFLSRSALSTFLLRHYDATNPSSAGELRSYMRSRYGAP